MLNVLVAVEKPIWRKGFQGILDSEDNVSLCYADSLDSVLMQRSLRIYDVIILNCNGSERTLLLNDLFLLQEEHPRSKFALIACDFEYSGFLEFCRAGVLAFLDERATNEQVITAVTAAARGDLYISRSFVKNMFSFETSAVRDLLQSPGTTGSDIRKLSEREMETLKLVARGMPNRAIAKQLFISEKTVKNHLYSAFKKLGVRDRTQAAMAVIRGLLFDKNGSFGPT